ncbi:uncharacterized protein LOC101859863 [Aplysia californica]|uniref:Uncharacterized protein LOC101859863 n=1 Tax=Aplysia californica TaxID=6500 RepID=A0ABM1A1C1_APLCA|nr:uncharacterized protein LOC101859863 [Aplysia californica]
MKCSWTHPEEYLKPKDISVDCNYMVLTDTKFDHPCPQLNYTNALWDADSFRAATYYFVEVGVTNTVVNLTISVTKEFKVNEIVKPSPIKDLIVLTDRAAPSCILLSWKHSKTYYNKVFRIKHQAEHQTDPDILATNWNQTSFKACGYGPMTEHWFTVDTLPSDPLSGYWSEQVTGSGWTVQTAPSVGPLISAGSYVSTKCKSGRRNVTFYWNKWKGTSTQCSPENRFSYTNRWPDSWP